MNPELKEKFENDVIDILSKFSAENIRDWKFGASISVIREKLQSFGWKNLGNPGDFDCLLEKSGFQIVPATCKKGYHSSVRIVII